ncbi:MAG TPA: ASKHA domain-containing protein, partial [Clostridia bacterium]|nr:ASKHA domain-containing protein [Clostridia bacterium]
ICGVWAEGGWLRFETIAGREPTGICGTGLIDTAATLLRLGMIDRSGRIDPDRTSAVGETSALVIDGKSGIVLTQKDIREIQLAKAAVAAGIETLLDSAGIQPEEIEKVYLSGGFGSRMHPDEAKEIGLFQKNLKRITACGNTSLTGAVLLLSDDRYRENIREISHLTGYLELSDSDFFNERFIENISF